MPLNPASPAPELQRELAVVGAVAVVVDRSAAGAWRSVDRAALADRSSTSSPSTATPSTAPSRSTSCSAGDPLPVAGVAPDHVAALMFTSGTAGAPRAAMLTHGNLLANIEQARSVPDRVSATDVVYGVIPAYHIFGLNVVLGLSLSVGATDRCSCSASIRPRRWSRSAPAGSR